MDSESPKTQTFALQLSPRKYAPPIERKEILKRHREWLESNGQAGERADFSGAHLDGADLTDANLEDAWLNKTSLKNADLLLANFERASLIQASLEGANLLGARFQEADLQGAVLDKATGLQEEQLAGANLFGATLPADVSVFKALKDVARTAREAGWLVLAMVMLSVAASFRVITTTDAQILGDAPILPFRVFRAFPLNAVYLLGPALILGLYVWLHLYLQRLWESVSTLPAIFPDGRPLDRLLPWFAAQVARAYLKWLQSGNRVLVALEAAIYAIILYWIVPATMILFWGRYLTFQDFRGTALHVLLVVAASLAAVHFSRAMKRTLGGGAAASESLTKEGTGRRAGFTQAFTVVLGVVILLLSIGVIAGSPRNDGNVSAGHNSTVQSWAADALWLIGYSPVAQVSGADISEKPGIWMGRDEDLALVRGARLSKARLRYIQGNGAFLAKADLWQADLQSGDLSEADLREIKARQASLRYATLDRAKLNRSDLQEADLRQANLTRADLEKADLTNASLNGASLDRQQSGWREPVRRRPARRLAAKSQLAAGRPARGQSGGRRFNGRKPRERIPVVRENGRRETGKRRTGCGVPDASRSSGSGSAECQARGGRAERSEFAGSRSAGRPRSERHADLFGCGDRRNSTGRNFAAGRGH